MLKWSSGHRCPMCNGEDITEIETCRHTRWILFHAHYQCDSCYAEYFVILHHLLWQFERRNTLYLYKDF